MKTLEKARFDTRLPKEQKELFEYAASLGGYRTLTDFVVSALQEKSRMIIEEHDAILTSKGDQELFFKAIMNPAKPNQRLIDAALRFNNEISK
jgi:uncharacterized protein (DUF1778 family)